jgi:hypothetical protein
LDEDETLRDGKNHGFVGIHQFGNGKKCFFTLPEINLFILQ